jgi:hypothetical protein
MSQELRAWPRENLALPILLADGSMAATRNVSARGMFLVVSTPLSVGERLAFEFDMPEIGLKYMATGEVVRVENEANGIGVALQLHDGRLVVPPHRTDD